MTRPSKEASELVGAYATYEQKCSSGASSKGASLTLITFLLAEIAVSLKKIAGDIRILATVKEQG